MAIHIQDFYIEGFRGIRELNAENINHVNLIVGDNNCGKTSVLEALLLLQNPRDISNMFRVARQRDNNGVFNRSSIYEGFINLFPKNSKDFEDSEEAFLRILAHSDGRELEYVISGKHNRIFLEESDFRSLYPYSGRKEFLSETKGFPSEAEAFTGQIKYRIGDQREARSVVIHEFSKISGTGVGGGRLLNMVYLSPVDYMRSNLINRIVRSDGYKEICIRVLQLFDPDITDLLILKNELTNRPVEYIRHRRLGNMPVSTYGDGIKKVLLLANAIVQAAHGVLLIDEVETAIHTKYYDDIFRFLLMACKQYEIQLFITTHNLEALDALLETQDYDKQESFDDISVLTLKRLEKRTAARIMPGWEVSRDRESFDFEVRL